MRSLIILEVEHSEDTDYVQELAEWLHEEFGHNEGWEEGYVSDYTFLVDLPEWFRLES